MESEHKVALDLQSQGSYAPSLKSIGRRQSVQSLDQEMVKKYSLKYQVDDHCDQSQKRFGVLSNAKARISNDFTAMSLGLQSSKTIKKAQAMEIEYNEYLYQYQTMFVLSC